MTTIAALVVSLPDRHDLLVEALGSVHAQTRPPDDTVVGIDPYRYGEVRNQNRLIDATDCEWLAWLHDDDLWHSDHLAVAEPLTADADVVVSRFDLVGRDYIEPWHDDFADVMWTNWFPPSCVLARKSVFGHWTDERPAPQPAASGAAYIDWTAWRRLWAAGARFADTRTVTVDYRFGDWLNGSWQPS